MKTPTVLSAGLLVFALGVTSVSAQIQIQQTTVGAPGELGPMQLPGSRNLKTGTGRISGRIVTSDTGAPVRRAQVRISGNEILPKTSITDNEGRYSFRDLPSGKFTLSATKSGYVTVQYGQTRPFEQGKTIELVETAPLDKADIAMPRGSVIAGRILDEFGDPLADATVTAMRSTWVNGKRRLQSAGRTSQTNDLGQYRIYGLPPGDYYVSATLRGSNEMMVVEMAMAAGVGGGGGGPQPSGSEPRSGYAPTYYPGTPNGNEAQKVTVASGQDNTNADFALLAVKLAKVTGTVIGSDGRPVESAMISVSPRNGEPGAINPLGLGGSRTDKNGNFTLPSVAPGEYTLRATGFRMEMSGGEGDRMVFTTRVSMGGDGQTEFGSVPLVVTGEDVSNVIVMTSKGTTASGHVTWEGGSKPANTAPLRITAIPTDTDGPVAIGGGSAAVTPEGAFEIKGLSGQRLFRATGVPTGWLLKSVKVNGQDVTDTGVDVKPNEPVTGLEVVLTSKTTEITGSVKASNQAATDYTVVIFAEDPQKWTAPMTRYITSARPNQDGRFQVKNLPAGSYYAVALDYIAQGEWNDPEVLERLKNKATKFTLEEGATETLDLRLQGS